MKETTRFTSAALSLVMLFLLILSPAGLTSTVSAAKSVLTIRVGETVTLDCKEGEQHEWG